MTTDQQRKILEAAAKSCGFKKWRVLTRGLFQVSNNENWNEAFAKWTDWNPLTNPGDTAEMCAKLALDTAWGVDDVIVMVPEEEAHEAQYKDHDNSRLNAWQHAATMVAAKIGGYEE